MPHKASILIVEDEAVVAADLAGKLERAGYRLVGTASRGEQAIELAKAEAPELVLMDIRLAGCLDGVDTADRLRAFLNIPIVYLTAHSDAETLKRAKQTEPFGYILKPFEERDLTTQIEIALYKHQAQILLRDSEARYRAVVETALDGIIVINRQGAMLSCNGSTERMFGYGRMEMVGQNVSMLMPPDSRDAFALHLDEVSHMDGSHAGIWKELKGRRKDGGVFPVEIALSRTEIRSQIHYTAIVRDISERRRAEAEIRWRADLLEQAHEAVIVWRMAGGIVYWNKGAAELYGWTAEEAAGRPAHELLHTSLPCAPGEFDLHLAETGGWYGEIRQRKKDGTPVIVESRMTTVASESGGTLVMETNRDVTERHAIHLKICRLAEELDQRVKDRTKELLRSQNRLRALATELSLTEQRERKRLAIELHDHLAQLLVLGRLKLAQINRTTQQLDAPTSSLLAQTTDVLDESLRYTRTLVADLSPPVLHDFGLPAALNWLGDYMRRYELTVTIALDETHSFDIPEDQAVLLFQSVRELLMNVHKHAGADAATVTVSRQDDSLRIEVRDKGNGFQPGADHASTVATEGVPDSRFGLFSIRERMSALGGSFHLDSAPGQGTMVTLTLPLGSRSEPGSKFSSNLEPRTSNFEPVTPFSPASPSMRSALRTQPFDKLMAPSNVEGHSALRQAERIRALLVDDHALVRQGLRSLLEQYADVDIVGEAGDGLAAVALALSLRPDVVLMDVNMPGVDGVEATLRIKAEHPSAIVIGLSMHNSGHYETRMKQAGAAAYLSKEAVADHLYATMLACRSGLGGLLSQREVRQ